VALSGEIKTCEANRPKASKASGVIGYEDFGKWLQGFNEFKDWFSQ
jgi:hypothetical protein